MIENYLHVFCFFFDTTERCRNRMTILSVFLTIATTFSAAAKLPISNGTLSYSEREQQPFGSIGTTDFYELVVGDGAFVDKSMLIDEILLRLEKVILISWPPGFGKSLNADMLRRFLEIETDERGQRLSSETERVNRLLFFGGRINYTISGRVRDLEPLEVTEWDYSANQQGTYPVVFLSFGGTRGDHFGRFLDEFQKRVGRLYRRYGYIEGNITDKEDRQLFKAFVTDGKISQDDLEKSLEFLCVQMERYFAPKKPFVILDDYDAPLANLLPTFADRTNAAVLPDDVEKTAKFVRRVLRNGLRFNTAFERAVIISQFPAESTNLIFGLEVAREFTVTAGGPFSEYYGFTQDDVNAMLTKYSLWGTDDQISRWYNGYQFGGTRRKIYNPVSIMRALQANGTCDVYWKRSLSDEHVRYAERLIDENHSRAELKKLSNGESVGVKIGVKDLGNLTEFFIYGNPYRYLLFAGYLTCDYSNDDDDDDDRKPDDEETKLKIPNHELTVTMENAKSRRSKRSYYYY